MRINNGEKSKPPAEGMIFLNGLINLSETSITISRKALDFSGETQLKITPPITAKNIILRISKRVFTIDTAAKDNVSY